MTTLHLVLILTLFYQLLNAQDPGWEDIAPHLDGWIQSRVTNANSHRPERVRIPISVHCTGWGCRCPDTHIGTTPLLQDGPYISLITPHGFPQPDSTGHRLEVFGYFTGDSITLDLRNEDGEPDEWLYHIPVFQVKRWKELSKGRTARKPKPWPRKGKIGQILSGAIFVR